MAERVDVEHSGKLRGLIADHPDRVAVKPREAADDVARKVLVHLQELAVVDDQMDHVAHVVRLVGAVGNHLVKLRIHPRRVVGRRTRGGVSRLFCGRNDSR